jgi:VWFA-related protein
MVSLVFERGKSLIRGGFTLFLALALIVDTSLPAPAQDQSSSSQNQQNPNQQTAPPEAGGPNSDVNPYAIPRKKEQPPPPPPPVKPKGVDGIPDYSIQVTVPMVTVPVSVTTKDGQFISKLKEENFRVFEDGVQQKISAFNIAEAPITAVLLVEFASIFYGFTVQTLQASYTFAQTLKKDDWVAVESYDMKPHILVDFTQDKNAVMEGLGQLNMPGFAETNIFDALYDTLDRIDRVEGHKYIILIGSGFDSFSRTNLNQILSKIKDTKDVSIFTVSTGWTVREYCENHGCTGYTRGMGIHVNRMDYLQADNEMQTYAKLTGGRFYQPRFVAEYPQVFHDIATDIRNQYNLAYRPTNPKLDGTYRKLRVEVVADDGGPLKVKDQKGKDVKYQIIAREGYTAKHTVE